MKQEGEEAIFLLLVGGSATIEGEVLPRLEEAGLAARAAWAARLIQ